MITEEILNKWKERGEKDTVLWGVAAREIVEILTKSPTRAELLSRLEKAKQEAGDMACSAYYAEAIQDVGPEPKIKNINGLVIDETVIQWYVAEMLKKIKEARKARFKRWNMKHQRKQWPIKCPRCNNPYKTIDAEETISKLVGDRDVFKAKSNAKRWNPGRSR